MEPNARFVRRNCSTNSPAVEVRVETVISKVVSRSLESPISKSFFFFEVGNAGIGVVYRDDKGVVLIALSKAIGVTPNFMAEVQAILDGLPKAVENGWLKVRVVLDSKAVQYKL
ncbi:hypothetical protein GIB67_006904 [Kingdonia uniflora]|uniref:RNase H type-1 domain-containing protein n=1 Tax=Kingdonia uniflora TaxID=39325 RepID=A0A7J7L0C5_9MAGN|nr:hypothetical protein GIB67_006904 [Kingdonia uniflora]